MKAGVLELPDVLIVKKADLGPEARRTAADLAGGLGLSERRANAWSAPVLLTSARDGTGVESLLDVLESHRRHLLESGELRERRTRGRETYVIDALERRFGSHGLEQLGGTRAIRARVDASSDASAFALVTTLGREIEDALGKRR